MFYCALRFYVAKRSSVTNHRLALCLAGSVGVAQRRTLPVRQGPRPMRSMRPRMEPARCLGVASAIGSCKLCLTCLCCVSLGVVVPLCAAVLFVFECEHQFAPGGQRQIAKHVASREPREEARPRRVAGRSGAQETKAPARRRRRTKVDVVYKRKCKDVGTSSRN